MLKAALFDFDGTLVDSDAAHIAAFADILAPEGVEVTHDFYRRRISGRSNIDSFRSFLPDATPDRLAELSIAAERRYLTHCDLTTCHDGAIEVLATLRRANVKLALVTNAPFFIVQPVAIKLGLFGYFDVVVTKDDVARGKPDPAPYLLALSRLGMAADVSIAIEDSDSGIASALDAGLKVLGFRRGTNIAYPNITPIESLSAIFQFIPRVAWD